MCPEKREKKKKEKEKKKAAEFGAGEEKSAAAFRIVIVKTYGPDNLRVGSFIFALRFSFFVSIVSSSSSSSSNGKDFRFSELLARIWPTSGRAGQQSQSRQTDRKV